MSIATTIIFVVVIIGIYYASMIAYDLYTEKMKHDQSEVSAEEPVDVSDQLAGFESYDISNQDETAQKKKALISWMCKGLSPEKMNSLMQDAVDGTPNADLKNIIFMCDRVHSSEPT